MSLGHFSHESVSCYHCHGAALISDLVTDSRQLLDDKELYTHAVKWEWRKVRSMLWKAVVLDVELDLAEKIEKEPQWQAMRLLFVRGLKEPDKAEAGKKDWALFLTTDMRLGMSKTL